LEKLDIMGPIKEPKRWWWAFIKKNQMMAIVDHCPRKTFHLNCAIPLVKTLKWSPRGKKFQGDYKE
jgi:hypothetical protein